MFNYYRGDGDRLKYPENTVKTPMKQCWNVCETSLKHSQIIFDSVICYASLKHILNSIETALISLNLIIFSSTLFESLRHSNWCSKYHFQLPFVH